jgi:hypothetical protein
VRSDSGQAISTRKGSRRWAATSASEVVRARAWRPRAWMTRPIWSRGRLQGARGLIGGPCQRNVLDDPVGPIARRRLVQHCHGFASGVAVRPFFERVRARPMRMLM